jgi:hypothetical protein
MQARERRLHLRLDPHRPVARQVPRRLDQVLQQRRIADPGLASQDQRPTLAPADVVDQALQRGALLRPSTPVSRPVKL